MSPEPTGVHGLLKQRKLFTHKYAYNINIFTYGRYIFVFVTMDRRKLEIVRYTDNMARMILKFL